MSDIVRYVVIPHYNRPHVARQAIEAIKPQCDTIFVVENSDKDPLPDLTEVETLTPYYLIPYEAHPCNLSHAWNLGLDACEKDAQRMNLVQWDVAIINDDAIVPPGWFDAVSGSMRRHGAAAGCSGAHNVIQKRPGPVPLSTRMQGWAFVVCGETRLRADEQFVWWYGDSDLDWRARQLGGMTMIQGYTTQNLFADQSTNGVRSVQAVEDGGRFYEKWKMWAW